MQDKAWLKFSGAAGFLNSPGIAIDKYTLALEILKEHGIDMAFFDRPDKEEGHAAIPNEACDEFVKLVVGGAKAKRLGIKLRKPEPFSIEMYARDGRKLEFKDFELLTKAIGYFGQAELAEGDDIAEAVLLGNVNVALGTQLSAYYDVDFIHTLGIACKSLGLETLEECAEAQDDENLMKVVLEMRKKRDREFEIVKTMPPTVPSFWDFFSYCLQHAVEEKPEE
ncbi:MAG: hypothetical protein ACYSYT_04665 [Planctomycetota bacterium]|jgi:hypothetical protein